MSPFFHGGAGAMLARCFIPCPIQIRNCESFLFLFTENLMKPFTVISHIVCAIALVTSIIVGFWGMNEYGVVPLFALLTLGGSFCFGTQLMFIITGE
jgi:hypothetical protein